MKCRSLFRVVLSASVLCAMLVPSAVAQFRAGIQGVVTDNTGAVVPGASVTLTSKDTNQTQQTTSNDNGVYTFNRLGPGHYSIAAERAGFKKRILQDVLVNAEQMQAVNIALEIGQVSESVTVAAVAPTIDTQTGNLSDVMTTKEVQSLPTYGRDPFDTLKLAPGVFGDSARNAGGGSQNLPNNAGPGGNSANTSIFQTENQVQVSANGQRVEANGYSIDGTEVNSLAWGGAAVITPNEESVKEVRVSANAYSAEVGRNSGAQVEVVSKNGTNDWHGSAFFKLDRPGLNAYQRWGGPNNNPPQRVSERFNQFGGSVGGPVLKDRLFFFFSYETLRSGSTSFANHWVESPEFASTVQAAAPDSVAATILSQSGIAPSYDQVIPRTCASAGINSDFCQETSTGGLDLGSPINAPLGTRDPSEFQTGTTALTPGIGGGFDGVPDLLWVESTNPSRTKSQQYNGRVDFQLTQNDLFAFSMYWVPNDSRFFNGNTPRPINNYLSARRNQAYALLWNRTISPTTLNEARFNVTRWYFNEVQSNPQAHWGIPTDQIGGQDSPFYNGVQWGLPGPGIFYQTTYNFRDSLSKVVNSHSLKFGVDIYKEQDNDVVAWAARPTYDFHNLWDFANDAPIDETGNFNPQTGTPTDIRKYVRSSIYALFVQDDWKLRPNLTVNLGLRWEDFTPIHEKYGHISNMLLGSGDNPLAGITVKPTSNGLYNNDWNNFGPQVGFAWSPGRFNNKFVVRGGAGIGFNRLEEAVTLNGRLNPPFTTSLSLFGSNILYSLNSDINGFQGWPSNPSAIQTFDATSGLPTNANTSPVQLVGLPPNLPTPYAYRYSLQTEYELGGNWVVSAGYQGSTSHRLTRQVQNLNLFYPTSYNTAVQKATLILDDVNSNYNALLLGARHRFSRSFEFSADYRFSKSMDNCSQGNNCSQSYPFNQSFEWGPSDFDVKHNFKTWAVWTPHLFNSNNWAEKLAGGWQLSGVLNFHTGFPWTPVINGGPSCVNLINANSINYGTLCPVRPQTYTGGALSDYGNDRFQQPNGNFPNGSLSYFVPAAANTGTEIPAPPQVGRNSFRGPRFFNVDMTLTKEFGLPKMAVLGEDAKLELRANFFNIFNKLNLQPFTWNSPSTTVSYDGVTDNPNFGQAGGALAGRVIEFQARFAF